MRGTISKLSHKVKVKNPKTEVESEIEIEGLQSFCISLSHDSLGNYYQTNFTMMQHFNYSLGELDSMIPWERKFM